MSNTLPIGHYVYLHKRESDLTVFYVGKGKRRRAWDTKGRNAWWKNVVQKHGLLVEIFKDGLDEAEALSLEMSIIADVRKTAVLVNLVDGGGGISGWKHSADAKAKISAFNKGKKLSQKSIDATAQKNRGKKRTAEQRLKLSLAKKGKPRPCLSEETKKKISLSHMGLRPTDEARKKMSESHKGKYVGKLNPTYDHTIRTFFHSKHGTFEGTRGDLILKYNIADGCLSSVISGKQKSVKGWVLL